MAKAKAKAKKPENEGCLICDREKESEKYCKYHQKAYKNIMESFDDWQEAYGELSFSEYLQKIIENSATGTWAKEVAEKLLEDEKSKK